ncbi:hypothetical protein BH11ARM2_BH11ARM2_03260 [soil metagenome]
MGDPYLLVLDRHDWGLVLAIPLGWALPSAFRWLGKQEILVKR